jgi:hypothetical protein
MPGMGQAFWDQAGWAVGIGIIICAISLRKALPHLAQAVAERIAGRTPDPKGALGADALEDVRRRLAELEERVDFAERLLAKPDAERLRKPPA